MDQTFAKYVRTEDIMLKYAKGMRDVYGTEMHAESEILFLISGEADFVTDSGKYKLEPFTAVVIPKGIYHQFVVHCKEEDYVRLIVQFNNTAEIGELLKHKMNSVSFAHSDKITALFTELRELAENPLTELETKILLKSLLFQIIVYVSKNEYGFSNEIEAPNPITQKVIKYIESNINNDLSLCSIAKALFISESYISHIFKQDMKIPIHKYILQKRLILANRKISDGMSVIKAAEECGFKDYSVFYRQYKKVFSVTPSKRARK